MVKIHFSTININIMNINFCASRTHSNNLKCTAGCQWWTVGNITLYIPSHVHTSICVSLEFDYSIYF